MWLMAFSMEGDIQLLDSNMWDISHYYDLLTMNIVRASWGSLALYATSVTSLFHSWYSSSQDIKPYIKELFLLQATQNIFLALACILPIFRFYFLLWNLEAKKLIFFFFNSEFCMSFLEAVGMKYPVLLG